MKQILLYIFVIVPFLVFGQCFMQRHSSNWFDSWMSCELNSSPNPKNAKSHWILYELETAHRINAFKMWNINDPSRLNSGASEVVLEYSLDSLSWLSAGEFSINKGTGKNTYEGDDWVDVKIPKAKFILITLKKNYGGTCYGFAEIQFKAEKLNLTNAESKISTSDVQLIAYPNPSPGKLYIELYSTSDEKAELIFYNTVGMVVKRKSITVTNGVFMEQMDISDLASGPYSIEVLQKTATQRKTIVKI